MNSQSSFVFLYFWGSVWKFLSSLRSNIYVDVVLVGVPGSFLRYVTNIPVGKQERREYSRNLNLIAVFVCGVLFLSASVLLVSSRRRVVSTWSIILGCSTHVCSTIYWILKDEYHIETLFFSSIVYSLKQ